MELNFYSLSKGLLKTTLVSLCWFLLFHINAYIFNSIEVNEAVSWVFLPAFIRLAAVLIFGYWGAFGLFFGTLLTNSSIDIHSVSIAFVSAISPLISIVLVKIILKIRSSLEVITSLRSLFLLVFMMAAISGFCHTLVFSYTGNNVALTPMVVGDIIGSIIMMYIIRYFLLMIDTVDTNAST